jgi:release factor glutamine methyltransferase
MDGELNVPAAFALCGVIRPHLPTYMFDTAASAPLSITPPRFARLSGSLSRLLHRCARLLGKHRYDEFRLEQLDGIPLLVTPSVFNPKLLRTGAYFASQLSSTLISEQTSVLDIGTGSGACALFAARYARQVTAVDINPAAVRCARINAQLNHLDHRIDVRHGDLFAPVSGQRFDLILFNPPFLVGAPRDDRDRAWRSIDIAERFAAQLANHLTPHGAALLLLSTFGRAEIFLRELRRRGFVISLYAERRFLAETVAIFRIGAPQVPGTT